MAALRIALLVATAYAAENTTKNATANATARREARDAIGDARERGMIGTMETMAMMTTTDGDARRAARADRGVRGVGRRALGDASGENLRDV